MSDISEGPLTQAEMPYRLDCIVMDTETTGFRVDEGHRLIEVATVEVEDDGSGIACSISTKPDRVQREKLAWQQKVRSDRIFRTLRKIARLYGCGQC